MDGSVRWDVVVNDLILARRCRAGAVHPITSDHPRWVFHFTPTSAFWLNAIEGFFSIITRRQIRRGVFKSVADLENAIRRYIREHRQKELLRPALEDSGGQLEDIIDLGHPLAGC